MTDLPGLGHVAYGSMIGSGNQTIVVFCINLNNGRPFGIHALGTGCPWQQQGGSHGGDGGYMNHDDCWSCGEISGFSKRIPSLGGTAALK